MHSSLLADSRHRTPGPVPTIESFSENKLFGIRVSTNDYPPGDKSKARVLKKTWFGYRTISKFPIERFVLYDLQLLISNSGKYFVVFHEDSTRIYRTNGQLIAAHSFSELLPHREPGFGDVPHQWLFDDISAQLVARLFLSSEAIRKINLSTPNTPPDPGYRELRIDLETGKCLTPKEQLTPWFGLKWLVTSNFGPDVATGESILPKECSDASVSLHLDQAVHISSPRLLSCALEQPLPNYPPLAKMARIRGKVIAEIIVSNEGKVLCARPISGPIQLRYTVSKALEHWTFDPKGLPVGPELFRGKVTMDFELVAGTGERMGHL